MHIKFSFYFLFRLLYFRLFLTYPFLSIDSVTYLCSFNDFTGFGIISTGCFMRSSNQSTDGFKRLGMLRLFNNSSKSMYANYILKNIFNKIIGSKEFVSN